MNLIDATGNVFMQRGEKRAKSKKAVYLQRDETLVLTGDPEAWEEGYRVTGTKMPMFLREDRSIVEGSRAIISDRERKPPGRPSPGPRGTGRVPTRLRRGGPKRPIGGGART